jgi:hypothetical protein
MDGFGSCDGHFSSDSPKLTAVPNSPNQKISLTSNVISKPIADGIFIHYDIVSVSLAPSLLGATGLIPPERLGTLAQHEAVFGASDEELSDISENKDEPFLRRSRSPSQQLDNHGVPDSPTMDLADLTLVNSDVPLSPDDYQATSRKSKFIARSTAKKRTIILDSDSELDAEGVNTAITHARRDLPLMKKRSFLDPPSVEVSKSKGLKAASRENLEKNILPLVPAQRGDSTEPNLLTTSADDSIVPSDVDTKAKALVLPREPAAVMSESNSHNSSKPSLSRSAHTAKKIEKLLPIDNKTDTVRKAVDIKSGALLDGKKRQLERIDKIPINPLSNNAVATPKRKLELVPEYHEVAGVDVNEILSAKPPKRMRMLQEDLIEPVSDGNCQSVVDEPHDEQVTVTPPRKSEERTSATSRFFEDHVEDSPQDDLKPGPRKSYHAVQREPSVEEISKPLGNTSRSRASAMKRKDGKANAVPKPKGKITRPVTPPLKSAVNNNRAKEDVAKPIARIAAVPEDEKTVAVKVITLIYTVR